MPETQKDQLPQLLSDAEGLVGQTLKFSHTWAIGMAATLGVLYVACSLIACWAAQPTRESVLHGLRSVRGVPGAATSRGQRLAATLVVCIVAGAAQHVPVSVMFSAIAAGLLTAVVNRFRGHAWPAERRNFPDDALAAALRVDSRLPPLPTGRSREAQTPPIEGGASGEEPQLGSGRVRSQFMLSA